MTISLCHGANGVRRLLNRRYDPVLRAAAADVAFQFASNLGFGWRGIPPKQSGALHDHARGAITALHGLAVHKRLLQRMQTLSIRQTFNRRDLFAADRTHRSQAGSMRHSVDQNSASAALAFAASVFRARQVELVP